MIHTNNLVFIGNNDVEDDEALARRLQEQEDALATRGRATRGALRVTQKPQPSQNASSREARHARGSASAAVRRSSSRLKPQTEQGQHRPMTRGSSGTLICNVLQGSHKDVPG